MCEFSAYVAFDKATNGQTDIKHEMGKTLSSMSLLKIVGEKPPPSQRSSLEINMLVLQHYCWCRNNTTRFDKRTKTYTNWRQSIQFIGLGS